ncbi:UNVERIFIED_ORG: outer membrane immunogenic protein [Martelella mediterranea]
MKKILLASAAIVAMAATAEAADVVTQAPAEPYVAPQVVPQSFDWSGFYLGGTAGYDWASANLHNNGVKVGSEDFDGAKLGGFAGYNYQFDNNIVVGVEGELDYGWNEETIAPGVKAGSDWEGSVRGRLGYAFDNALLYATGGWALANGYVESDGLDQDQTFSGWTVGAGLDYAFTENLFGGLEYRYTDFGKKSFDGALSGFEAKDYESNRVMARVGYKF